MSKSIFQNKGSITLFLLIFSLAPIIARAQTDKFEVPATVQKFIAAGDTAVALESADLNGDGTKDFILVTEKTGASSSDEETESERTLMIITSDREGQLKLAKSNTQVVYCKSCGGAFGDPFASLDVGRNTFTVNNYGGSAWRWSESYQFNYSRIDQTWQLVRAESESFNSLEPEKVKTTIRTPKNFGKVDIADFDLAILDKPVRKK